MNPAPPVTKNMANLCPSPRTGAMLGPIGPQMAQEQGKNCGWTGLDRAG
jgi:hypothetical protein